MDKSFDYPVTAQPFCIAACKVLGVDASRAMAVEMQSGVDQIFALKFTVAITVDDLDAIAQYMKEQGT